MNHVSYGSLYPKDKKKKKKEKSGLPVLGVEVTLLDRAGVAISEEQTPDQELIQPYHNKIHYLRQ